jgi:hypothetical protein
MVPFTLNLRVGPLKIQTSLHCSNERPRVSLAHDPVPILFLPSRTGADFPAQIDKHRRGNPEGCRNALSDYVCRKRPTLDLNQTLSARSDAEEPDARAMRGLSPQVLVHGVVVPVAGAEGRINPAIDYLEMRLGRRATEADFLDTPPEIFGRLCCAFCRELWTRAVKAWDGLDWRTVSLAA